LTSSLEAEAFSTLKAGTVTKKVIRFGDVELPPIVSGVMQDTDLRGNPSERNVKMIAVRREHIDALLAAVAREQPELAQVMDIVREYLHHMDGVRDHAKLGAMVAEGWLIEGSLDVNQALGNLRTVTAVLGRWRDEHRLNLH
jgi:hypothetical protein